MVPCFDYVPTYSLGSATLRVIQISGVSTKHGEADSDRGRLYAAIAAASGGWDVSIYSDALKTALVASGEATAGVPFALTEANDSGVSGRAILTQGGTGTVILIPTFAVDSDVMVDEESCASLPGYDAAYGLASLHAQAMREILTSSLPAAIPHLTGGQGLANFLPMTDGVLPDLRTLANPDNLRVAQASLVKALSAEQSEHLEEFMALAKAARERYAAAMEALALANTKDEDTGNEQSPSLHTGRFIRG